MAPTSLVSDARRFLGQLNETNTRDWFQANKKTYETQLRDPAKDLLSTLAPKIEALTGYPTTTKLFRPNRDVRFSKDKTPYNTHLHMMWMLDSGARQDPSVFFGIGLDYVTIGTGMMEFTKDVLPDWRNMVDLDGDRIAGIIDEVEAKGYEVSSWSPVLKRVPPPFDKDHAHGALLKRKGLTVSAQLPETAEIETALMTAIEDMWPVSDMLVGVAEAPTL